MTLIDTGSSPGAASPLPGARARRASVGAAGAIVGLLALIPFVAVTRGGIGISPDATRYLTAARTFADGHGLLALWWGGRLEPLTHFPPLYPVLLGTISMLTGADAVRIAWWLDAALLVTNVALVGALAARIAGGRVGAAVAAALIAAASLDIIRVHAFALSEPAFITFALLSLAAVSRAIDAEGTRAGWRAFALSALLAAAAALTRYVGIALIGAGAIALLALSSAPWRARLVRATTWSVIAVAPLAAWTAHNAAIAGTASNRKIVLHPITPAQIELGARTVGGWVSPYVPWSAPRFVLLALTLALLAALALPAMRARPASLRAAGGRGALPRVLALFVATYGAFLIVSISLADADTGLDMRLLAPALVVAIILAVALVAHLAWSGDGRPAAGALAPRLALGAAALYVASHVAALVVWVDDEGARGLGLRAVSRDARELLDAARRLPSGARVYSNGPDLVYFFTGRVTMGLPRRVEPTTRLPFPGYAGRLAAVASTRDSTFIVYFTALDDRWYVATAREVESRVPVRRALVSRAGFIDVVPASRGAGHR